MALAVTTRQAEPQIIAAVRRTVRPGEVGAAWKHALDLVWAFLGTRPQLRQGGRNFFLYDCSGGSMQVDFGVEVPTHFETTGEVQAVLTPAGEVASATDVGSYDGIPKAHEAIRLWVQENGRALSGISWEIYGHWTADTSKLETTVEYLLS